MGNYQPLYAERRCLRCGRWRGEHIAKDGNWSNNSDLYCPTTTFIPGMRRADG